MFVAYFNIKVAKQQQEEKYVYWKESIARAVDLAQLASAGGGLCGFMKCSRQGNFCRGP